LMRRWLFIVVPLMAAGVAVGLVVSVLTSSPVVAINTGPSGNGGNRQVACTWTTPVVNDEYTWLGNRGSSPATITRVGLLDPRQDVEGAADEVGEVGAHLVSGHDDDGHDDEVADEPLPELLALARAGDGAGPVRVLAGAVGVLAHQSGSNYVTSAQAAASILQRSRANRKSCDRLVLTRAPPLGRA